MAVAARYAALKEYALSFDFEQGVQPLSSWHWPAVRLRRGERARRSKG